MEKLIRFSFNCFHILTCLCFDVFQFYERPSHFFYHGGKTFSIIENRLHQPNIKMMVFVGGWWCPYSKVRHQSDIRRISACNSHKLSSHSKSSRCSLVHSDCSALCPRRRIRTDMARNVRHCGTLDPIA